MGAEYDPMITPVSWLPNQLWFKKYTAMVAHRPISSKKIMENLDILGTNEYLTAFKSAYIDEKKENEEESAKRAVIKHWTKQDM